ncbi:MAG: hypothetical protein WC725_00180 [Patescibacteria group bacterium]|jgi:hypothetical protein
MLQVNKFYIIYSLNWLTLAVISVFQYPMLFSKSCFFQKNWLFCAENVTGSSKFIDIFIISIFFINLFLSGIFCWKVFKKEYIIKNNIKYLIIGLSLLLPIFIFPFGSGDMTHYFSSGKAASGGINLYSSQWNWEKDYNNSQVVEILAGYSYGPIVLDILNIFYKLSNNKIYTFILFWKIFMVGVVALCGYLIKYIIKMIVPSASLNNFYIFWFTQPIFLFECLVDGHFDILWLVFLLLAIIFAHHNKWWLVFPLLAIGVWIKFIPILVAPWFLLWWWQKTNRLNWKSNTVNLFVGSILTILLTIGVWYKYWVGFSVFNFIILQSKWAISSIFSVVYYSFLPFFKNIFGTNYHWYLTRFAHAVVLVAFIYLLVPLIKNIFKIFLKKQTFSTSQYIVSIFISLFSYLVIWQKSIWPWYFVWILPLGLIVYFISRNLYLEKLLIWLGTAPLISYIVWFINWQLIHTDAFGEYWYFCFTVFFVTGYPLYNFIKWRKQGYSDVLDNVNNI